jgi:hypothetical protein
MPTYAKVQGNTLISYPYDFNSLLADNPYTNYGLNNDFVSIFPNTESAIANGYTLVAVTQLAQPTYDPATQICAPNVQPSLTNGVWGLDWRIIDMTEDQITAYTASLKSSLLDYSASARYTKSVGGITVSGIPVATDLQSQAQMTAAYNLATVNATVAGWVVQWKMPTGLFAPLTAAQIIGTATVAGGFVQACFTAESGIQAQINNGAITTTAQIDTAYAALPVSF